jgi:signal transduction histidine kinase
MLAPSTSPRLAARGAAETPSPAEGDDAARARRAGDTLRARLAVALASVRVVASGLLGGAWFAFAGRGATSWYAAAAPARGFGLVAAIGVLAALPRDRRPPTSLLAAGVSLDVASLALGGWRALHAPPGGAALLLAVADLCLPAAVLALAAAQLAVGPGIEREALRLLEAAREALSSSAEWRAQWRRERRDFLARAESLAELVVHDLRNPLTVVLANVSLAIDALAGLPDLAEEREDLQIAHAEALRLSAMIGDLLVVPRLERGELRGHFAAGRVRDLLDTVARAREQQASAKGLRVEVVAPPELVAWIDELLVRRMLENLVGNALRHAPRGGRIELSARLERDRLLLAVRNDGPAVDPAVRARLFQKYATHGQRDPRSCGLGLYLCRMVAELHGGRIALVEREGWSVSFEASLPLGASAAPRRARGPATPLTDAASPNQGEDRCWKE